MEELMEKSSFYFRVRISEIEIEAEGTEEYVREIKEYADQLISNSLSRIKTLGAVNPNREIPVQPKTEKVEQKEPSHKETQKEESLVEFLDRLPNKTHQDKIIAFAYYLEQYHKHESFGVKEINDCYDEVKEVKTNTAVYINLLLKSGLIMKAKNQPPSGAAQYVLTRKGESLIKEKIDSETLS